MNNNKTLEANKPLDKKKAARNPVENIVRQ